MISILTVLGAALLSTVVGIPWAALLGRARAGTAGCGLAALLSDSVAVGLMVVVLGLSVFSWIGVPGLAACVLLQGVVVTLLLRRRVPPRRAGAIVRGDLRWRDVVWGAAFVAILVGALLLRRHPSDFVAYTGDMGAYPSWANQFARTGSLSSTWPPAFSMLLVLGGLLTGPLGVTAIVPVTGILLIVATVRLLRLLGVDRTVALLVAAVIAVHPAAVWFSRITLSESLHAPLLLLWLTALVGALRGGRHERIAWTLVGGLTLLTLSLLRGTAPLLLAPLVVLAVGAAVVPRLRPRASALLAFLAVGAAAATLGYWYGIDRIPDYYVDLQLRELLPGAVFRGLQHAGLLHAGVVSAAVAGGAIVILLVAAFLLLRLPEKGCRITGTPDPGVGRATRLVEVASGLVLVAVVVQSAVGATDVWQILGRLGLGLVGVALLGPFVVAATRHGRTRALVVIVATLLASLFVALQLSRLAEVRPHIVHLYWDRYLFSEFFPLMMILVGLALGTALDVVRAQSARLSGRTRRRLARGATGVALPTAAAALVAGLLPETALLEQKSLLQGARAIQTELGAAMPDRTRTVLWGASAPGAVDGSGFPNTWQAFGLPLAFADGYRFDNGGRGTSDGALPDVVLSARDLERAAACSASQSFYVVESELPGGTALADRIDPGEYRIDRLAEIRQDVVQLPQPAPAGWTSAHYGFDVYGVTPTTDPARPSPELCASVAAF